MRKVNTKLVKPAAHGVSVHEVVGWWFGGEGKCTKSVHDKIHPKKLNPKLRNYKNYNN